MSHPLISVVTLTWNSARHIPPMLATLLEDAHESDIPIEVILIDNGSSDGSVALIEEHKSRHPEIVLVPLSSNHGTTMPRNIGIRMARGTYVLILDSDTEMPRGTLRRLVEAMDVLPNRDTIGIVCPRLVYPNGDFQESARRFPTLPTKVYRLLRLEERRRADETLEDVVNARTTQVDYAISAAWLVPRATFDQVGLLDERIFYAPEDVEFCARVWKHGLTVWYYPEAQVVHNCQRLTNKRPFSRLGLSHAKDLVRYWWEYRSFFVRPRA